MCSAPPATFPRADGKVKKISLPEDVYIKKFFQKHPDSKHEDAIKYYVASICLFFLCSIFYWRKLMAQIFICEQQQQQKKKNGTKRSEFVLHISSIGWQPWMFANILILHELGICVIEMYPACCWPYFCLLFRDLWLHACTSYIPENT